MRATGLETLVYARDLIMTNKPGKVTRPGRRKMTLTINLMFITYEVGLIDTYVIDDKPSIPSYYEVIVCDLEDMDRRLSIMSTGDVVSG